MIAELAALDAATGGTGRVPISDDWQVFHSFAAEAQEALSGAGPRVRRLFDGALTEAFFYLPRGLTPKGATPPWRQAFASGVRASNVLTSPATLTAALEDAVDAAAASTASGALGPLMYRLDNLRAIAENQDHRWPVVSSTIETYFSELRLDSDGHRIGGKFKAETSASEVWSVLSVALARPPVVREYVVWLATLAGPGGLDQVHDAVVSGPIASSGIPCTGGIVEWAARVRQELSAAFLAAKRPVPEDVAAFGSASQSRRPTEEDPESLWRDVADPPSFVSRVAVEAVNGDEAIHMARRALAAVFARRDSVLAKDIRPDVWIWSPWGGWQQPSGTARGRSRGEVYGARKAAHAVANWGSDLGSPLDRDRLDLLESRALVRDETVAFDARLLRAWSSLEALAPRDVALRVAGSRQWLHAAWSEARTALEYVFWNVALNPAVIGPLRDGTDWELTRGRMDELESRLGTPSAPRLNATLFDDIRKVMSDVHPHAMSRLFVDAVEREINDPAAMERAEAAHRTAWARAQRHRNLVAHGWRLPRRVLAPTVAYLSAQLELAAVAHGSPHEAFKILGGLHHAPRDEWKAQSVASLIEEIGGPED